MRQGFLDRAEFTPSVGVNTHSKNPETRCDLRGREVTQTETDRVGAGWPGQETPKATLMMCLSPKGKRKPRDGYNKHEIDTIIFIF